MNTETLIQQHIAALPSAYRQFVDGEFSSVAADTFGSELQFDSRRIDILQNAIILFLCFIFNRAETIAFITYNCDLQEEAAESLWLAIETSLPTELLTFIQQQSSLSTPEKSLEKNLVEEIKEMEQSIARAPGLRTMAADMQAVVEPHEKQLAEQIPIVQQTEPGVYQSSQSNILENKSAPTPPPKPTQTPRWDSDSE